MSSLEGRKNLNKHTNRASVLSNEKYRGVKFILSKDNLKICANNPSKESAEEEISVNMLEMI